MCVVDVKSCYITPRGSLTFLSASTPPPASPSCLRWWSVRTAAFSRFFADDTQFSPSMCAYL